MLIVMVGSEWDFGFEAAGICRGPTNSRMQEEEASSEVGGDKRLPTFR
jgi:hypothetical protein